MDGDRRADRRGPGAALAGWVTERPTLRGGPVACTTTNLLTGINATRRGSMPAVDGTCAGRRAVDVLLDPARYAVPELYAHLVARRMAHDGRLYRRLSRFRTLRISGAGRDPAPRQRALVEVLISRANAGGDNRRESWTLAGDIACCGVERISWRDRPDHASEQR